MTYNERYHIIFEHIDKMLWEDAEYTNHSVKFRLNIMNANANDIKNNISAYVDAYVKMLSGLLTEERFSKFPVPDRFDYKHYDTTAASEDAAFCMPTRGLNAEK